MKRKTLLGISLLLLTGFVFCLIWHDGSFADDPPQVSNTTIIFTDEEGIRVSTNTDTVTKYKYCSMSEHPGNSSCGTNTPSDHPITTRWYPWNRTEADFIYCDPPYAGRHTDYFNSCRTYAN